jgi:hypothetical protein
MGFIWQNEDIDSSQVLKGFERNKDCFNFSFGMPYFVDGQVITI